MIFTFSAASKTVHDELGRPAGTRCAALFEFNYKESKSIDPTGQNHIKTEVCASSWPFVIRQLFATSATFRDAEIDRGLFHRSLARNILSVPKSVKRFIALLRPEFFDVALLQYAFN
jgi:hypothetical protein